MRGIKTLDDLKERMQAGFENNEESLEQYGKTYSKQLREIVESILARSKLKEKDVEEIDNIIKRGLFEKYYKTKVGS